MPPALFRERLRGLSGTPEVLLQDEELMDLMSPLLRSDFELSETYKREQHPPLRCPISAFGGMT